MKLIPLLAAAAVALVCPGAALALDATAPAAGETVQAFTPTFTWDQTCPTGATCRGPKLLIGRCGDVDIADSSRLALSCRGTGIRGFLPAIWDGTYPGGLDDALDSRSSLPWREAWSEAPSGAPARWDGNKYLWAGRTWYWQARWDVYDPARPDATSRYVVATTPRAFSVRQRLVNVRIAQTSVNTSRHSFRLRITGRSNSMIRRYTAQVRVGTRTICTLRGNILNARTGTTNYADAFRATTGNCVVPAAHRGKRANVRLVAPIAGGGNEVLARAIGAASR